MADPTRLASIYAGWDAYQSIPIPELGGEGGHLTERAPLADSPA